MDFQEDIKELNVIPRFLTPKFKNLEGTRHIIQYEARDYVFTLSKTYKPKIECFGITNRCADGKFILFLDYDKIYKDIVFKNLSNLIKLFPEDLDNFYIATTEKEEKLKSGKIKGSYHVVNFVKNFKFKIEEMIKYCDVDPYFIKIPHKTAHKCHVLRVSNKFYKVDGSNLKETPEFLECYPRTLRQSKKECSLAHFKAFQRFWKLKNPCYPHNFDDSKTVEMHKYSTPKGAKNAEKEC